MICIYTRDHQGYYIEILPSIAINRFQRPKQLFYLCDYGRGHLVDVEQNTVFRQPLLKYFHRYNLHSICVWPASPDRTYVSPLPIENFHHESSFPCLVRDRINICMTVLNCKTAFEGLLQTGYPIQLIIITRRFPMECGVINWRPA